MSQKFRESKQFFAVWWFFFPCRFNRKPLYQATFNTRMEISEPVKFAKFSRFMVIKVAIASSFWCWTNLYKNMHIQIISMPEPLSLIMINWLIFLQVNAKIQRMHKSLSHSRQPSLCNQLSQNIKLVLSLDLVSPW